MTLKLRVFGRFTREEIRRELPFEQRREGKKKKTTKKALLPLTLTRHV